MKRALSYVASRAGLSRSGVAAARMCCERHFLASFGQKKRRYVGRILCYHSIGQRDMGVNDVTPAQFRSHIETALNAGFRFVPASEIVRTGGARKELAITFDDGLKSVLTEAAPILKEYGLPWSFFPVSEWCEQHEPWTETAVLSWRDVEALMHAGAELGSHSATHPDFSSIEPAQMADELGGSRETIAKRIGVRPTAFAIPLGQSGNWTPMAAAAAREAGYEIIYAQAEETRPADTIARSFVTRFDGPHIFKALLAGKFDTWEEWV